MLKQKTETGNEIKQIKNAIQLNEAKHHKMRDQSISGFIKHSFRASSFKRVNYLKSEDSIKNSAKSIEPINYSNQLI